MHNHKLMDQIFLKMQSIHCCETKTVLFPITDDPDRVIFNGSGQSAASCSDAPTFFLLQ